MTMNFCEQGDIVFISDLHLSQSRPHINRFFISFLENITNRAKALYILGDFFEYFIGSDEISIFREDISNALLEANSKGLPIYCIHGNRDFLLGSDFFEKTKCQLLDDPSVILIQNQRILLSHGDLFCTHDIAYQRFRKFMRKSWAQLIFLHLPLWIRKRIANQLKMQSGKKHVIDQMKMDVVQSSMEKSMQEEKTFHLIHGHTHKPAMHLWHDSNGREYQRWVLGAWDENPYYLIWSARERQFILEKMEIPN